MTNPNNARLTIGVTTFNEAGHLAPLLDALAEACRRGLQVILYDDCSADHTVAIIRAHPVSASEAFRLCVAQVNHGGPAAGRQHIADAALTDYVTYVDGDDRIDVARLGSVLDRAPDRFDLLVTPYDLRGKAIAIDAPVGRLAVTEASAGRLVSSIAGKIYRTEPLRRSICQRFVRGFEDARMNLNFLNEGPKTIVYDPDGRFYTVPRSRRSRSARRIDIEDLAWQVQALRRLAATHGIGWGPHQAVRRYVLSVVDDDRTLLPAERAGLRQEIRRVMRHPPERLVLLCEHEPRSGAAGGLVEQAFRRASGRSAAYRVIGAPAVGDAGGAGHPESAAALERLRTEIARWRAYDTVVLMEENVLPRFPDDIKRALRRLPLIYVGDVPLSFRLQETGGLAHRDYRQSFKVARILAFSDIDIAFQRQLGLSGQVKGFMPVETRMRNAYAPADPPTVGCAGGPDYLARAAEQLARLAAALREHGYPPLRIVTAGAGRGSRHQRLLDTLEEAGVRGHCEIVAASGTDESYLAGLSLLFVPAGQDRFGGVVHAALAAGVPVIASRHAAAPSELVHDGVNGFLLDDVDGESVVALLDSLTPARLAALSDAAFATHQLHTDDRFFELLENLAADVLSTFKEGNRLRVLPELRVLTEAERERVRLGEQLRLLREEVAELKRRVSS